MKFKSTRSKFFAIFLHSKNVCTLIYVGTQVYSMECIIVADNYLSFLLGFTFSFYLLRPSCSPAVPQYGAV